MILPETLTPRRLTYQGTIGSFSHEACQQCFPGITARGHKTFEGAVKAVEAGEADMAVIPVENSTGGRVSEVYHIIPEFGLHIVGEFLLDIHHNLMVPAAAWRGVLPAGLSGKEAAAWKASPLSAAEQQAALATLREVRSHAQGLAQCRRYLARHVPAATLLEVWDTAGAARDIAALSDRTIAAIAPKAAAERFNMLLVAEAIEDCPQNVTRFLFFAPQPLPAEAITGPALTSILFETDHRPGALLEILRIFEAHGINMTKLETYMTGALRPLPSFYVDLAGSRFQEPLASALKAAEKAAQRLRILGSYPASPRRVDSETFLAVG